MATGDWQRYVANDTVHVGMRTQTKFTLFFIALAIIILGGVVPNMPMSMISGLPEWIKELSLTLGGLLLLLYFIWLLQDIETIMSKKKHHLNNDFKEKE